MTTQDKPAVGPLSAGDTKQPWYLGSMNDGLFIINRPPRPSGTDAGPMMHDDGPTMVIPVMGLTDARAQAICDAHNASLAPTAPVCGGCNDCEVCVPGTVAGDRAIAADTEFLAAAAALNAPPMDIVTVYDAGRRVIFKVKGDGTVEGGENTDESALIFAQAVSHHLRSMGFAPTAPVEETLQSLAQAFEDAMDGHGAWAVSGETDLDTGKGGVERETIAKLISPSAFLIDPPRQRDSETKACQRESALKLAGRILAALRPQPSGQTREVDEPLKWFLKMIEAAGGWINSSETPHNPINVFCDDRGEGTDTVNLSEARGYTHTTHDSDFDISTTVLTDQGRTILALLTPDQAKGGAA